MSNPIFFVDRMLNDLAIALRLAGFVSISKTWETDEALISEAQASNGFILTSSKSLVERLEKKSVSAVFVPINLGKNEKMILVLNSIGIKELYPETICPVCNGILKRAGKNDVVGKVPESVMETFSDFLACPDCNRIFWQGSHWKRIKTFLEEVKEKITSV